MTSSALKSIARKLSLVGGEREREREREREMILSLPVGIVCLSMFLVSFPFILGNGEYLFQLVDQFAGTLPLLFVGVAEIITVAWIYGVDKYVM